MTAMPESIRVHQHGYAHVNHESAGKKCEFGSARDYFSQRSDIANGKSLLADLLGFAPEPIFTPPWNRCTTITARCLLELGFKVISRDAQAAPLGISGLIELPIEIDWFVHNKKVRLGRGEWGSLLAAKLGNRASVGIMLHHAVMDAEEMQAVSKLLALLATHAKAECLTMHALAPGESSLR